MMTDMEHIEHILEDICDEYRKARKTHNPMNSRHEGYAVLLEEVEEMWDEIKKDADWEDVRKEAVQVGAMLVALIHEVLEQEKYE